MSMGDNAPMTKLHILGIAGTFMGGVAALARELGHDVEGSDQAVYPPMSTQLEQLGIALRQGYAPANISPDCDRDHRRQCPVARQCRGRAGARRRPQIHVRRAMAGRTGAAGTRHARRRRHARQDHDHQHPDVPARGGRARAGLPHRRRGRGFRRAPRASAAGRAFVVEADEYDTAFFDKRSKFVHYRPLVAILNNLEYDHADIFPDVEAIQRQFHHFVRTVPRRGRLIVNGEDARLAEVLAMGCWTPVERFGLDGGDYTGRRGWSPRTAARSRSFATAPRSAPCAGRCSAATTS